MIGDRPRGPKNALKRSRKAKQPKLENATMDVDEVAQLLGVSRRTVYRRARVGELPGQLDCGRLVLFSRREMLAWVHQGRASAAE